MILYWSHQAANSREFLDGCPGPWPRVEERVGSDRVLTIKEEAAGFLLITEAEHAAIRAQHKASWEAWETAQKVAEELDTQTKRTEAKEAWEALEAIRISTGDLPLRQLSNLARLEVRILQALIRMYPDLFRSGHS